MTPQPKQFKIAILCDCIGWAYYNESIGLKKYMDRYTSMDCDVYPYETFYLKMSEEERNKYHRVFLFPRYASPLTYPSTKTIVRFSSFGGFAAQKKYNTDDFLAIVCMNKTIEKEVAIALPHKQSIISYIPVAVDTEMFITTKSFIPTTNKLKVGFAGASTRNLKNYPMIQEAMSKLGDVIEFKEALSSGKRLAYADMPKFYNQLDLLVCMSTEEGGPLPPYEGGLCGVPTITSCTRSAIGDTITDNYNGFKIEHTVQALINKIIELNNNRELLLQTSKNIIESIKKYHSWEVLYPLYEHVILKQVKEQN